MAAYLARRKTAARAGVSWQGAPGNRIFMKENKINRRNNMEFLWEGVMAITPQQFVMYLIGGLLIWLAVKKEYEPALLLPMGFGAIMVNLPLSGVINQVTEGIGETQGIIQWLFETTISASEALPILLFIGIGAMIDFGPLLSQPIMFLFGAAAQFGIFFAICVASLMGFELRDAASIGIIGAADGPTSILVSQIMHSNYVGAIAVAAYSYMALVPIIQPFAIRLVTTKKERRIHMTYSPKNVSKTTKIAFPIVVTIIVGLIFVFKNRFINLANSTPPIVSKINAIRPIPIIRSVSTRTNASARILNEIVMPSSRVIRFASICNIGLSGR